MSDRNFFAELKRRNVYKVAVAYIVAGWALAQGLAQVLPVFDVPNWVVRLLIVLLILGFPIALGLAWVYEITPEGIKRTENVDPLVDQASHRTKARGLNHCPLGPGFGFVRSSTATQARGTRVRDIRGLGQRSYSFEEHRRPAVREPQRRQIKRLFCRRHPG